jgi:tetratricopeptide (TPR) repeat protein
MDLDPNTVIGIFLLIATGLAVLVVLRKAKTSRRVMTHRVQYQKRIEQLDMAIRRDPTNAMALWQKGEIYEALGHPEQALRFYRSAHVMCPKIYSTGDYTEAYVRINGSPPILKIRRGPESAVRS